MFNDNMDEHDVIKFVKTFHADDCEHFDDNKQHRLAMKLVGPQRNYIEFHVYIKRVPCEDDDASVSPLPFTADQVTNQHTMAQRIVDFVTSIDDSKFTNCSWKFTTIEDDIMYKCYIAKWTAFTSPIES